VCAKDAPSQRGGERSGVFIGPGVEATTWLDGYVHNTRCNCSPDLPPLHSGDRATTADRPAARPHSRRIALVQEAVGPTEISKRRGLFLRLAWAIFVETAKKRSL